MKITRLTVSNLLRIKAAEVTPDGALVVVAGRNDQGKSSLLNSIALALSGKELPVMPIRQGAASGHVILQTETLTVTRRFSQTGGSLEVRDADGAKITSPQTKLDELVSRTTFDPFEFTRQKPDEQLKTLKVIAGLDFDAINAEHHQVYNERTEVNRKAKIQEGKLQGITRDSTAPIEEVSVSTLMKELEAAQQTNRDNDDRRRALSDLNDELDSESDAIAEMTAGIEILEQQLQAKKHALKASTINLVDKTNVRDALKVAVAALNDADTETIAAQLRDADQTNQKVRDNAKWNEEHKTLIALQQQSQQMTERLNALASERDTKLKNANFPVEGLGFTESGVTFNDIPFEQAGTAMKIRTSIAIARSLNPKLPVMLIRDASLLDAELWQIVEEEAEKHGLQVWMEVVGTRDDATVVIEDGEVIDTPAANVKKKKK